MEAQRGGVCVCVCVCREGPLCAFPRLKVDAKTTFLLLHLHQVAVFRNNLQYP